MSSKGRDKKNQEDVELAHECKFVIVKTKRRVTPMTTNSFILFYAIDRYIFYDCSRIL